jgi:hypothetical protein
MTTSIPLSELQSSPAAKFENVGDTYAGTITGLDERNQTDPVTGQVKTFASGDPQTVWVITIEQANGETIALWARGGNYVPNQGTGESMLFAIGTAVKNANASAVEVGGRLAVRHSGIGKPTAPGLSAPRLFVAQYEPPANQPQSIPAADLFEPTGDQSPF